MKKDLGIARIAGKKVTLLHSAIARNAGYIESRDKRIGSERGEEKRDFFRAERKPNNYFKKDLEVTKINFIFALPNTGKRQTERIWRRIMTH